MFRQKNIHVKKIAYTCCSNNYLAQAKILGDSLIAHNPDYVFVICLIDHLIDEIDYSIFKPHIIKPIEEIGIFRFDDLAEKYNIIELNTAVKASCCKYLLHLSDEVECVFYFDPDIKIFNSLTGLEVEFEKNDILLTPHTTKAIPLDDLAPQESVFLNYGIYNLGFIGVKKISSSVSEMLDWWEERKFKNGYIDVANGVFVDQLYMNHVPLFFNKVKVLREFGYNAAPWNLHERKDISLENGELLMNDGSKLTFFHFSSYSYLYPEKISKSYNRYSFDNCPDLKPLYKEYHSQLLKNNVGKLSQIECFYVKQQRIIAEKEIKIKEIQIKKYNRKLSVRLKKLAKALLPPIITSSLRKILF